MPELLLKCFVDPIDQRRECPEIGGKMDDLAPAALDDLLDLIVRYDVCPTKPVDGLLRVTDNEQSARNRPTPAPIRLVGVVGSEEHQDLGLYWVRVLEFIHQDAPESPAKIIPNDGPSLRRRAVCISRSW